MREPTGKGNVKSSAKESAKIVRISKQRRTKFNSIRKQVSSHTREESSGGNDSSEVRIRGGADSATEERSKDSSRRKKESPSRNVDEDGKGHKNRREMAKSRQEIDNKSAGDSTLTKKEAKGGGDDAAGIDEKLITNDPSSERKRKKERASRDQSPDSNLCGIRDRPPNSIEYQLSNPLYVELGWTVLPITRNRRKIVEYRTVPAKPHLNRLKMLECEITEYYDGDGPRPFLDSHADGSAEIYYPNGKLAMKVYSAKERNYDMYTVFTPGGKDASSGIERESQITAIFDSLGNGVVFDEVGATRLSYNQFGGFSRDYPGRPPYSWPWAMQSSKLTSETVYVEKSITELEKLLDSATAKVTGRSSEPTEISRTSSPREKGEKSAASKVPSKENQEVVKETFDSPKVTRKAVSSFPIKPVCLKINDYFSLRIFDRKNINLLFIAARKKLKIELGTTIDLTQVRAEHYVDADRKSSLAKNRFQDTHLKSMELSGSLRHLIQEYKKFCDRVKNVEYE